MITLPNDLKERYKMLMKANRTLDKTVIKTCDIGKCELCGGYTSSGMNPYCYKCANEVIDLIEKDAKYSQ
jgi:ABC-type ATPase with predicted acetyltransferase domain